MSVARVSFALVEIDRPERLDPAQFRVLALGDSASCAVIGAPGTGKTTALVELLCDRVHNRGFSPDEVLVITPTRASATALRDRLALRLGVPSNGPLARTANSIAFQIVRGMAAVRGDDPPVLLTGAEQDQIISELLAGDIADASGPAWPEHLGDDVRRLRGFRTELRDLMMRAVETGTSADRLAGLAESAGRPEWAAAAQFIEEYDRVKASYRDRSFDSAELAREAAVLLREAESAPDELEAAVGSLARLRLLVLDDAQESTLATLTLVREFARRGVTVVAFGDPDISTGTFRGAHPDTLARLDEYLGVPTEPAIVLDVVHRHGAHVRSLVADVTARIGTARAGSQRRALAADDAAHSRARSGVSTVLATSPSDEIAVIARRLREAHVFEDVAWDDMAVIVRSGSQIAPLERGLAAFDVPTRVSRARVALRDEPVVRAFASILEIAFGRRALTAELAEALLLSPLAGSDAVLLRRLKRALRQLEFESGGQRTGSELLVDALQMPLVLARIEPRVGRKARLLASMILLAREGASTEASVEELLWQIWETSGLAEPWRAQSLGTGLVADETAHDLDAVVALFSSAKRFVERSPEAPATVFLEQLLDVDVPEDTLARAATGRAVTVMSPAGAVGTEFALVVVSGLQENVWPNLRIRGTLLGADALEGARRGEASPVLDQRTAVLHDELRMFAQAISRAAGELLVTAVDDDDSSPSPLFRLLPEPVPGAVSRTPLSLRGLVGVLRRTVAARGDSQAASALATLAREAVPGAHPAEWYGLAAASSTEPLVGLSDEAARVTVSPSRMESFETCPLNWLIDHLGGGSSNTSSQVGTLIHEAMETSTTAAAPDTSEQALFDLVDARWGELYFESSWLSEIKRREARQLVARLSTYLADFDRQGGTLLGAESKFELEVDQAVLRGTIDRVELYPDGSVVIVDLKTGKRAYTAAEIGENAQLGAYQLAFDAGLIEGVPADATPGGARLLIVSKASRGKNFVDHTQTPRSPSELEEFRQRILTDASGMAGSHVDARIGSHCLDPWSHGACRIHVIRAVSA
ncbi:Superfamily I DNA or RNA helicase [Agreia bicolorata]|uniref:DNA 3'-5' helicase n=1 Tax=Agreia bicolorata TaxID=110935 RepID=A0A1T4YDD9_9MICO|nr:Superfamily I DNA or RNA helicase [Agreia bicolorata]